MAVLLAYAGSRRGLTFLGLVFSAVSMLCSMAPYICIWLAARDLIAAAPEWTQAKNVSVYGWTAFAFAAGGIVLYFAALMCTHLAAFRTASNIRKQGVAHVMKAPLGFFDANASGLIRGRLDAAAADTETLLAHNLADIVGTVVLFVTMIIMMFVFDWRMGAACLLAAVISIIAMFSMMGGKNVKLMAEYQAAQDRMTKAGTEYVRGIPVVKIFQQTVYSFKAFQEAIEDYSRKAEHYQADVCRLPQAVNLTFTEGAFVFLVPVVLFLAPDALASGSFAGFVTDFAFYAVFSAIISTALAKIMFASSGVMLAGTALGRISQVLDAPVLEAPSHPQTPRGNQVEFKDVSFTYSGADNPALSHVSFTVKPGQTVALVGPSGGGKTTAASLIPRFWDVTTGAVEVGGVNVTQIDPHVLMEQVAFVFQNSRLFKASILENVRAARPNATREEVMAALTAAQCSDIIDKLPEGIDTQIGTEGTYLSGGEQQRIALARAILKDAPFDQSLAIIAEMFVSQVSADRMNEIYDTPTADGAEIFEPKGHDIVFEHVDFSYDKKTVLHDVSFTAKEGEVTALVGPSGSGKSTCARLAARLWDISGGVIRVGGVDISSVDPEVLLGDYSMVFQDVVLFDDTVMENIRLGKRGATDEEVQAAAKAANCEEFVKRLPKGYDTPIGENGAKLSGGERQRISIARALLKDAPIVLLDEATASLDVENETKVQGALSRLLAGKTVLVIAHRMRTVEAADKIVVLKDGKVAEEGSPENLMEKNGIYHRMVELQRQSAGWRLSI